MVSKPRRRAYTLSEVLIVVTLIALLISLTIPAIQAARAAALRVACGNRLRQLAIATVSFEAESGYYPPGPRSGFFRPNGDGGGLTWLAFILPALGQGDIWADALRAYRAEPDPAVDPPHRGLAVPVREFVCDAEWRLAGPVRCRDGSRAAFTTFLGVEGSFKRLNDGRMVRDGVMTEGQPAVRSADVTDGLSHTLMIGERPPSDLFDAGRWYSPFTSAGDGPDSTLNVRGARFASGPNCSRPADLSDEGHFLFGPGRVNNPCDKYHFWSLHPGGAHFAWADGGVRFMPYSSRSLLPALASRAGGEAVPGAD